MKIERLVIAAPEGWRSPSARDRLGPVARAGLWHVDAVSTGSFPAAEQVGALLDQGGQDAALVLQRVMPGKADMDRLRGFYRYVVFDIDDAIYVAPPKLDSPWLARAPKRVARLVLRGSTDASSRKRPLERTLARVGTCVVGNSILGDFVRRHTPRVVEIPTTCQPISEAPTSRPNPPVVVWHGLMDNLQHMALARDALAALARDLDFRLRIIASATWKDSPVPVEFVPWSPEALREGLLTASVGLAPLTDDLWTRGKCAFRAIQYAGHALPTVASPVGITDRVVLHGKTGYLASSCEEWEKALRALLTNPSLAEQMGKAGLRHIQAHYSDSVAMERWRGLVESIE
jgi:glycosyltransferase involved in cell wall biosynthesis